MKIEIDVDLGPYAEEWEPVAIRSPQDGDWFLSDYGQVARASGSYSATRLILRKKWKWPAWLLAHWIFKSEHGGWLASFEEPVLHFLSEGKSYWIYGRAVPLYSDVFDFTPPPCTDFTKSKMRNPNLP